MRLHLASFRLGVQMIISILRRYMNVQSTVMLLLSIMIDTHVSSSFAVRHLFASSHTLLVLQAAKRTRTGALSPYSSSSCRCCGLCSTGLHEGMWLPSPPHPVV